MFKEANIATTITKAVKGKMTQMRAKRSLKRYLTAWANTPKGQKAKWQEDLIANTARMAYPKGIKPGI